MDVNNAFQDFINKSDDNTQAPSLGVVIKNIFISCDSENTGIVPISKVIDFIAPFLQGNADALDELRTSLVNHVDANDQNTLIDYETLYRNMKAWTEKMSATGSKDDVSPNMHELEMNRQNFPIARDLFKNYTDSPESTILSLPELASDTHEQCLADRCTLENHILELQHQKAQLNDELTRMRSELSNCQEQNESLQGNLDKLVKKLTNEQKLNENLQIERKKSDEIRDELSCANKKITKLEKNISSVEKVNNQLQQDLDVLQRQKQNLEQKINYTEKKSEAVLVNIRLLESEIGSLKQDLTSEQDTNIALMKQNEELQDVIEQCNISTDKIKLEKEALEKLLRDQTDRNESLMDLSRTHNMLNTSLQSNLGSDDCEVLSLDRRTSESNDEYVYYSLHVMMNSSESLQDEMKKATYCEESTDRLDENNICDCQTRVNKMEVEKKLVTLQCELLQHESCTDIIQKQKEEIKHVSRENCDYKEQMESVQETLTDLRTQISLGEEKERLLLEKCSALEENLKHNNSYVTEIQSKLSEYSDLESKCKILNEKIAELETDNSMKYIKIINLTMEMEKLRQVQSKADQQNKEELSKSISQLEEERRLHEEDTKELFNRIKVLNEEKETLQQEKETLLTKIIELDKERRQLQTERDTLLTAKENLEFENCEVNSKKDMVELQIVQFQSENEALQMEKNLLKSENINLEIAKDELETKMKDRLEKLEKTVRCLEVEKQSLLVKITFIQQEKDKLEGDAIQYKNQKIKLKNECEAITGALRKLQTEYDRIKSSDETLQHEAREEKRKNIDLTNDNAKMADEIDRLIDENMELSKKTTSVENELKKLRKEISHYVKTNEDLDRTNQRLTGDNDELLLKLEKSEATLNKMDIENKQLSVDLVNLKLTFDKVKGTTEKFERFNETLIAENRSLQNSLKEKENLSQHNELEIKELLARCGSYESEMNTIRNELDQCLKDRENLKDCLKAKEEMLLKVEDKLEKNIENTMLEMKAMQDEMNEKQIKIDDLTKDICCLKKIEKQLKSDLDEVSKELVEKSVEYDKLSKENSYLESELSEMKTLCQKMKETSENLAREDVKSKEVVSKFENRIAFLEKQNDVLTKEKDNWKNMSEESGEKLTEALKTNAEFIERNKKLTHDNSELSLKCNKLSEDLVKRKEMLEKANADIDEVWNELKMTKRKVSDNEQERLGLYKKKIDRYEEENAKIKNEIKSLKRENETIFQKSQYLEREHMETKQQLENLLIEKDAWLTEKINIYSNSKTTAKATTFDRLTIKTMKLDDRIAALEDRLTAEKRKNTEKLKQITELQGKNGLLLAENVNMKQEIDATTEEKDFLKSEMEELIAKIDNLIEENEKLARINGEYENMQWKFDDLTLNEDDPPATNLQGYEIACEVANLQEQLENEITKRELIVAYIESVKDRLCKRRLRLGRATIHAMKVWKDNLDDGTVVDASEEGPSTELVVRPPGPLDEEMFQVDHQIHVTTSLLDKLTSLKNHILLESSLTLQNSDSGDTIEQDTSSNIDGNVLEHLGLSGDCVRVNDLTAMEMEEKFTALVLAFTIDRTSLRQRCTRQKNQLRERERALGEVISTFSSDLEKYVKESSEIDVSSRLEHILSLSAQISISAEQYGSLVQQSNLSQGVELMVDYVASLRRNIENLANQCQSIEPTHEIICQNNDIEIIETNALVPDKSKMDLHVANQLRTKKSWNREIHLMFTLSMAVLVAVIFLNMFGSYEGSFRVSPLTPPT